MLSYRGGLPAISQGINFNISICIISASYFDRIQVHKQQQKADTFKKSAPHLLLREEEGFIVSAELPGWQRYKMCFNCLRMNKFQTFKKSKTNKVVNLPPLPFPPFGLGVILKQPDSFYLKKHLQKKFAFWYHITSDRTVRN